MPWARSSSPNEVRVMVDKVGQDPNSHLFYDVDWSEWLTARGFLADGSQITSTAFVVEAPGTKTFENRTGAVARVWVKDVPKAEDVNVTCTISMPEPDPMAGLVTDDFTFCLRGSEK